MSPGGAAPMEALVPHGETPLTASPAEGEKSHTRGGTVAPGLGLVEFPPNHTPPCFRRARPESASKDPWATRDTLSAGGMGGGFDAGDERPEPGPAPPPEVSFANVRIRSPRRAKRAVGWKLEVSADVSEGSLHAVVAWMLIVQMTYTTKTARLEWRTAMLTSALSKRVLVPLERECLSRGSASSTFSFWHTMLS